MKTIKRYANRKLYDTERSSYVTLDEIAEMVRTGEDLEIVDQKTGEDLTSVTLTQKSARSESFPCLPSETSFRAVVTSCSVFRNLYSSSKKKPNQWSIASLKQGKSA